jgi:hypothetical protein
LQNPQVGEVNIAISGLCGFALETVDKVKTAPGLSMGRPAINSFALAD